MAHHAALAATAARERGHRCHRPIPPLSSYAFIFSAGSFFSRVSTRGAPEAIRHRNRGVGDIEDQKGDATPEVQVEEIHYVTETRPIEDIAERAAQHQPERENIAALLLAPQPRRDGERNSGGQPDQQPALQIALDDQEAIETP